MTTKMQKLGTPFLRSDPDPRGMEKAKFWGELAVDDLKIDHLKSGLIVA